MTRPLHVAEARYAIGPVFLLMLSTQLALHNKAALTQRQCQCHVVLICFSMNVPGESSR